MAGSQPCSGPTEPGDAEFTQDKGSGRVYFSFLDAICYSEAPYSTLSPGFRSSRGSWVRHFRSRST